MKCKKLTGFLLAALLMAASIVTVYADGIRVQFNGEFVDVYADIVDDRALIPARAVVEMLGGSVGWDEELRQVTIDRGDTRILLTIDDSTAYVNGVAAPLDVPPQIIEGRTKVPLRFVGENLGVNIYLHPDGYVMITDTPTESDAPAEPVEQPIQTPDPSPAVVPPALSDFFEGRAFVTNDHTLSDGTTLKVYFTPAVRRNEDVIVRFDGKPGDSYNLSIRYKSGDGTADGLGVQTVNDQGFVAWRWHLGGRTTLGDWPITITGNGETIKLFLTVLESE